LRVTYQNEHGQTHSLELEEYMARVFQHEFDHLEGKLFLDYLPRELTEKHRLELTDMQRQAKAFLKEEKERAKTAQSRSRKGKR
jgi:peptide deformylase